LFNIKPQKAVSFSGAQVNGKLISRYTPELESEYLFQMEVGRDNKKRIYLMQIPLYFTCFYVTLFTA